jgi:hypothetical protein
MRPLGEGAKRPVTFCGKAAWFVMRIVPLIFSSLFVHKDFINLL